MAGTVYRTVLALVLSALVGLSFVTKDAQGGEATPERVQLSRTAVAIWDELNAEMRRREMAANYRSLVMDPTHPLSELLAKRAPLKFFRGGRDAAKSWGAAEAVIRVMNGSLGPYADLWRTGPYRFLCTREYQNSIKDSVHRLLLDQIERMGLAHRFVATKSSLLNPFTGSEVIYKGLHHNVEEVKSTEGIDVALIEEGQNMTEESWQTLEPTIRKDGSEIWCLFNVTSEDSATHVRATAVRDDIVSHIVNYDKNPFLSDKSRRAIEWLKQHDYEAYLHVYGGQPRKVSNAVIFAGRYRVENFPETLAQDAIRESGRIFYGLDHGFASDPYALVRFFILGRKLYIEYEAFGVGVEFAGEMSKDGTNRGELEQLLDTVPGVREWPIKADNSRPETISFIAGKGFNVTAAEKWKGCEEDGLAYIKSFEEIIIHERCKHMQQEARLYRYKVDAKTIDPRTGAPQVLPVIVDKNNHGWDAVRYGLDGYIKGGDLAIWAKLAG